MELFERYVHQVGKRLPRRNRADVEAELRSLLADALEDRDTEHNEYTDSIEAQAAVLEEFGPPAEMADSYMGRPEHVIGPRIFRLYMLVCGAIALAALVAAVVTTAVSAIGSSGGASAWPGLIARGMAMLWNIFVSGVGMVTIVFAILERTVPDLHLKAMDPSEDEAWNPRDLPEIVDDAPKVSSLIAEIAFMALFIVLFAGFGSRINIGAYYRDGWHTMPGLLAPAFFELYLPYMLLRWALTIVLNLLLLRKGQWQTGTRAFDLALKLYDLGLLIWMISGPAIINDAAFAAMLGGVELPFKLSDMVRWALGLGALGNLVELVKAVLKMLGVTKIEQIAPTSEE